MKLSITKRFTFEMGHFLSNHSGKCAFPHGHSYTLDVTVGGGLVQDGSSEGMVIDFYDLKTLFGPLVNDLDHSLMVGPEGICLFDGNGKSYDYMQERIRVMNFRPTTENLAVWIAERLEGFVDKFNADRDDDYPYLKLEKIQLFETATGWVTVEL